MFAALLAAQLLDHNPAQALDVPGFRVGVLAAGLVCWWYSFLRWPWVPLRQLIQRWLFVVASAVVLALLAGLLLNPPASAVWFHRSTLLILGLVLGLWGTLIRRWLHPLALRQAALALGRSPVAMSEVSKAQASATAQRQLLLLLVAYHPSALEVKHCACLAALPEVGYAVVNGHQPGEPVEQLAAGRVPRQSR